MHFCTRKKLEKFAMVCVWQRLFWINLIETAKKIIAQQEGTFTPRDLKNPYCDLRGTLQTLNLCQRRTRPSGHRAYLYFRVATHKYPIAFDMGYIPLYERRRVNM